MWYIFFTKLVLLKHINGRIRDGKLVLFLYKNVELLVYDALY